jgi:hypothetical protein
MVQGRRCTGFLEKAAAPVLLRNIFRRKEFKRDNSMKFVVIRLIDGAHTARGYQFHDSVVGHCPFRDSFHDFRKISRWSDRIQDGNSWA